MPRRGQRRNIHGGSGAGFKFGDLPETRDTLSIVRYAAPHAAKYLFDVITRVVKKPSWQRIDCCKFIIESAIGKPAQRHELTGAGGAPLSLEALWLLAEKWKEGEAPILLGARVTTDKVPKEVDITEKPVIDAQCLQTGLQPVTDNPEQAEEVAKVTITE